MLIEYLELQIENYSLRLKEGDSVQKHVKAMIQIFDALAAAGAPVKEEDRVAHLLARLPDPYDMLVTALEKMEIVKERLLHEESKLKGRVAVGMEGEMKAMTGQHRWKGKGPKCHHCGRFRHIRRTCRELTSGRNDSNQKEDRKTKHKAHSAQMKQRDSSSSESESTGLVADQVLSASSIDAQDS